MADKRITQIGTTYDKDDYVRTTDYLIGDRSGGSSFRILAEEAVLGVLESVAGNVGIGTTSPKTRIHTYDSAAEHIRMERNGTGGAVLGIYNTSGKLSSIAGLGATGGLRFDVYNGPGGTETRLLTLTGAGNVGIGTESPGYKLDVTPAAASDGIRIADTDFSSGAGPRFYLGRNSNASTPSAGHFVMIDKGGGAFRVWVDDSGNLRIWTSTPTGTTDTSGTVIGTQTSMAAAKNIYADLSPLEAVAERIRLGAESVRKFAYKSGSFNGQKFEGVVVDEAPEYGMDRDAEHPAGKSLNEIQIIGDLLRMVADLSKRVAELEMK